MRASEFANQFPEVVFEAVPSTSKVLAAAIRPTPTFPSTATRRRSVLAVTTAPLLEPGLKRPVPAAPLKPRPGKLVVPTQALRPPIKLAVPPTYSRFGVYSPNPVGAETWP